MAKGLQSGFHKGIGYGFIGGVILFMPYIIFGDSFNFLPYIISVIPLIVIYGSLYVLTPRINSKLVNSSPDGDVMRRYYLAIAWPFGSAIISNFCLGVLISGLLFGAIYIFSGKIFILVYFAAIIGSLLGMRRMHPDMYLAADAGRGDLIAASDHIMLIQCRKYLSERARAARGG